jgi:capsular exopolysaccharide synthesis family protein
MHNPNAHGVPPSEGAATPDLQQLLLILKERYWVLLVCVVSGLLAAGIYVRRLPVVHQSTAVLQLEPHGRVLGFDAEHSTQASSEPPLQTILEAFKSRSLLERAVRDLHLEEDRDFSPITLSPEQASGMLLGCLEVRQRRSTSLIDIVARHGSAKTSCKLANGVAAAFIQMQLDQRASGARAVLEFLLAEAERLKKRLQRSEEALQNYKEANQAAALEDRQDTVTASLKAQGNNFAEARSNRIRLESDLADMERFRGDSEALLRIVSIAQHPLIVATRAQIAELQSQISTFRLRYTAKHPKMIQAATQLSEAETLLKRTATQIPFTLQADLERALSTENAFEAALKEQEKQALALNRQSIEFKVLSRDVETDRALYESILRRLKETDVARSVQLSDLRVFESAVVPGAPAPRSAGKFLALGMFAGLVIGTVVILGGYLTEGSWRTAEEIEAATGLPVLSAVPKLSGRVSEGEILRALSDPSQQALEAFRSLRTALHLGARKKGRNCFLFTSALPDDGKSFCSLGYALTLARQGVRTLLIDADLRSPSLDAIVLGSARMSGLAEVLEGRARLSSVICETDVTGLHLLPAGRVLPDASELLTRKGIHSILGAAREQYDCIVVDSAPIQSVSDALLLAEAVDTVCLVVRYAATPRKAALRALHLFNDHGTPVEGIVLNHANPTASYGYYSRSETGPLEATA